jgi:UMF1 family MFS transporter
LSVRRLKKVKPVQNIPIAKQQSKFKLNITKQMIYNLTVYLFVFVAITAVVNFSALYFKRELGIDEKIIGGIMLGGQLIAFPLTILAGKIAKKMGIKRALQACLIVWIIGLVVMSNATSILHVCIVVFIISFVIGSTPSLIRAHFSLLVDDKNMSEQFGYYGIANKSGSILSPLIVSLSISTFGSIRDVYVVLIVMMAVAIMVSFKLKELDARNS